MMVTFNKDQRDIFLHSSGLIANYFNRQTSKFTNYISLKQFNQELLDENAQLMEEVIRLKDQYPDIPGDSSLTSRFDIIPATIINQSINQRNNLITLNKGSAHGLRPSMGVMTENGIVGITVSVSVNNAQVMSLLHSDTRISASIEDKNYFGSLVWPGRTYDKALLQGIPKQADIVIGSKIITNGYSTIFPKNLVIGEISGYEIDEDNMFFNIEVALANDFSKLSHVFVLKNSTYPEQKQIEDEK